MDTISTRIFEALSLDYMFSVILASYLVIKSIDALNGERSIPSWVKRMVTCVVGAVLFVIYREFTDVDLQCLITSFFSAVFVYDTAIKVLIEKLNAGYKK